MKSAKHSECAAVEDFGRHPSWQRKLLRSTISVSRRTPPRFKHSDPVCFVKMFAIVKSVWQFAFDYTQFFSGPFGSGSLSQEYADWVRWLETHWHIDHFVQKKNELGPAILCLQHPAILFHLSFCSTNFLLTIHSYHESCLSVWSAKQQIRSPLAYISLSRRVATSSEPLCLSTQFAIVADINIYSRYKKHQQMRCIMDHFRIGHMEHEPYMDLIFIYFHIFLPGRSCKCPVRVTKSCYAAWMWACLASRDPSKTNQAKAIKIDYEKGLNQRFLLFLQYQNTPHCPTKSSMATYSVLFSDLDSHMFDLLEVLRSSKDGCSIVGVQDVVESEGSVSRRSAAPLHPFTSEVICTNQPMG